MPSLLDMADVPMTNILEQCDFKSVLTLRKVCHDLRNFIDDANFKTDLSTIDIDSRRVLSRKGNKGRCPVSLTSKSTFTHNCEHLTPNDLKTILNLQNSKLSSLIIRYKEEWDTMRFMRVCLPEKFFENHGTLDDLEDILKNKPRPLQAEKVKIEILLEDKESNEIGEIMDLDQFENASELSVNGFLVNADLKKFFHFERIAMKFQEVPLKDLVALKEAFTTCPHMQEFRLHHYKMDKEQFEKEFGEPSKDDEATYNFLKKWYFKMQTSKDEVLEINYTPYGLSFRRMKATDVEQNLVVRD
ncbi:unnamed protein product [Caenorhabditis brenneri]